MDDEQSQAIIRALLNRLPAATLAQMAAAEFVVCVDVATPTPATDPAIETTCADCLKPIKHSSRVPETAVKVCYQCALARQNKGALVLRPVPGPSEVACDVCGVIFTKTWDDEEKLAELQLDNEALMAEDLVPICIPCHRRFTAARN